MKYLNDILINWNNSDFKGSGIIKASNIINKMRYQLIYTLNKPSRIKIFDGDFVYFDKFKDKVYINDEHVELTEGGITVNKYEPSEYQVYIDGFDKLNKIGDFNFCYCAALTKIIIPNSVKRIGDNAFYFCTGLTSITIPNSVEWIGKYAFFESRNLKTVYVEDIDKFNKIDFNQNYFSNPTCYGAKLIKLSK